MMVRNISEAKSELSALVEAVLNGAEVIIAKAGKPVARLVAYQWRCPTTDARLDEGRNLDVSRFRHPARRYGRGIRHEGVAGLKLLLDTHILLWWLDANPQLSEEAVRLCPRSGEHHFRERSFAVGDLAQAEPRANCAYRPISWRRLAAESFENLPLTACTHRAHRPPGHGCTAIPSTAC